MIYIGIDPGQAGGIVAPNDQGEPLFVGRMPSTDRDLWDVLGPGGLDGHLVSVDGIAQAYAMLERVRTSPQMGVVSAGTFMKGYGALGMALVAARIPHDEVSPQRWQAAMGCLVRGRGRREIGDVDVTAKKNMHKQKAQELFPSVTVTHSIADALLIAEYARRTMGLAL